MNLRLPSRDALWAAGLTGAGMLLLWLHTSRMGWFLCDDAYITLRYARQWVHTGAPFFNPGEPVEGYTNFLWMAVLAAVHHVADARGAALVLGALSGAAVIGALASFTALLWPGEKNRAQRRIMLFFLAVLCAGFAPFAFWVSTGMETMFFTALCLWAARCSLSFTSSARVGLPAVLLWSAAALTRPEGVFLGAAFLLAVFVFSWRDWGFSSPLARRALAAILAFGSVTAAHWIWRRITYGQWLPLTYHAKVSGIDPVFLARHGAAYVHAFFSTFFLYPPAVIALFGWLPSALSPAQRRAWMLLAIPVFLLTTHTIRSGGDFMAMFRFQIPLWPFFSLLAALGVTAFVQFLNDIVPRISKRAAFLTLTICALLWTPVLVAAWRFENVSLASERPQFMMESITGMVHFAQDRVKAGRVLHRVLPPIVRANTFMLVGGAGALPYESDMGRVMDSFGLLDPEVARMRITPGSFTKPGHLKQASWQRVRELNPDILCNPGVAYLGRGAPPAAWTNSLRARFPEYEPFCIKARFSRDDRGVLRTHYCCLRKRNKLEQLTMETTAP